MSRLVAKPLTARRLIARPLIARALGEGAGGGLSQYAVNGFEPGLVMDPANDYYKSTAGVETLASLLTFSRASTATYVDSSGTIQTAASGVPRINHVRSGGAWVPGLLVESEARTNLATESEAIESWASLSSSATYTAGAAVGPDGEMSAFKQEQNSSDNFSPAADSVVAVPTNSVVTQSVFAKSGTVDWFSLDIGVLGSVAAEAFFDVGTGVVGTTSGADFLGADIEEFGDWQLLCYITYSTDSSDSSGLFRATIASADNNLNVVAGDSIYYFGAQLEAGSTPSSYMPTSGATATRAAETVDGIDGEYDSSAMWFAIEGFETYADEGAAGQETLFDWRADANNRITLTLDTDGAKTGEITLTVVSGGTSWSVSASHLTPGVNRPFDIACRVTDSEINLAVDGAAQSAVSTTSIPDLSSEGIALGGQTNYTLIRQGAGDVGDEGIEEASA